MGEDAGKSEYCRRAPIGPASSSARQAEEASTDCGQGTGRAQSFGCDGGIDFDFQYGQRRGLYVDDYA